MQGIFILGKVSHPCVMPKQHHSDDQAEKNTHIAFPKQCRWQMLCRGVTMSISSPGPFQRPFSTLNPKTQKWIGKRWKEAWSSNWTSSSPQEGCGCPPAVSQGPGGHPSCTTPALVQLPRPIPPATEEPASPNSWEQEELIRGREGRGGC